jgi:hypothetical protein
MRMDAIGSPAVRIASTARTKSRFVKRTERRQRAAVSARIWRGQEPGGLSVGCVIEAPERFT